MKGAITKRGERGVVRIGDHLPFPMLETQIDTAVSFFEIALGNGSIGNDLQRALCRCGCDQRDCCARKKFPTASAHRRLLPKHRSRRSETSAARSPSRCPRLCALPPGEITFSV